MSDSATEYDKLFIGGKWTKPSTSCEDTPASRAQD